MAVKRIRLKTLQKAALNAMEEECMRVGERERGHCFRTIQMYEIGTDHETAYDVVADGQISTVLESLPRY